MHYGRIEDPRNGERESPGHHAKDQDPVVSGPSFQVTRPGSDGDLAWGLELFKKQALPIIPREPFDRTTKARWIDRRIAIKPWLDLVEKTQ